jgi:hypothetical protein
MFNRGITLRCKRDQGAATRSPLMHRVSLGVGTTRSMDAYYRRRNCGWCAHVAEYNVLWLVCIHQIPASSMTERTLSARLTDFELIPAHDTNDKPITLLLIRYAESSSDACGIGVD